MGYVVQPDTEKWAKLIRASWVRSTASIIETGRLCIDAKNNMAHGQWEIMVEKCLPFSLRTAERLMCIARHPVLAKNDNLSLLPPHTSTLYELSKLEPDEVEGLVADGVIHADMEADDLRQKNKADKRASRERELGDKQRELPGEKFGIIVADPEWQFQPWSRITGMDRAADNHYPTSCLEVIMSRPVEKIAADDCVLFLWATQPMLPHALAVMDAWGFDYKSNFVWCKDRIGTGYWNRNKHEHLLIGTRGKPPAPTMGTQPESVIIAPATKHSAKPEVALDIIDRWFPNLPKIELNRRGPARPGWKAWGNESETSTAASPPGSNGATAMAAAVNPPGTGEAPAPRPQGGVGAVLSH